MHHDQNREKAKKRKLSKKDVNFCGNRGKFINFDEIGGKYAICIIE